MIWTTSTAFPRLVVRGRGQSAPRCASDGAPWNLSHKFNDLVHDFQKVLNRHLRLAIWTQPPKITSATVKISLPTLTPPAMSGLCQLMRMALRKFDIASPPCHPASSMMHRKQSVLLLMVSWTMLSFLASSFATCPKASFILSKPIP